MGMGMGAQIAPQLGLVGPPPGNQIEPVFMSADPLPADFWDLPWRERRQYEKMRVDQVKAIKQMMKAEKARQKAEERERRRREERERKEMLRFLKWVSGAGHGDERWSCLVLVPLRAIPSGFDGESIPLLDGHLDTVYGRLSTPASPSLTDEHVQEGLRADLRTAGNKKKPSSTTAATPSPPALSPSLPKASQVNTSPTNGQ